MAAALLFALPTNALALTAWERIDSMYEARSEDTVLPVSDQLKAAEAARHLGKAWERYNRLMVANALTQNPLATAQMAKMEVEYGLVDIQPRTDNIAIVAAFGPDSLTKVQAIHHAQETLDMGYGFRGMLPVGNYVIGHLEVVVEPGLAFTVYRPKAPKVRKSRR